MPLISELEVFAYIVNKQGLLKRLLVLLYELDLGDTVPIYRHLQLLIVFCGVCPSEARPD